MEYSKYIYETFKISNKFKIPLVFKIWFLYLLGPILCDKSSREIIPLSISPIWEHVKNENNHVKEEKEDDGNEKMAEEIIGKILHSNETGKNEKMEGKKGRTVSADTKSALKLKLKLPSCVSYDKCFQGF